MVWIIQNGSGQEIADGKDGRFLNFDNSDRMFPFDVHFQPDGENAQFQSYLKIEGDITVDETFEAESEYEPYHYLKRKIAEEIYLWSDELITKKRQMWYLCQKREVLIIFNIFRIMFSLLSLFLILIMLKFRC